jgi:formiminotetrahydrofolate cyclodeaminase
VFDGFGSGQASPGSGSAAAFMGLLAAKLIITVCLKSIEKSNDEEKTKAFHYLTQECHKHYDGLRELFEADAVEFRQVVDLRKQRDTAATSDDKAKFQRLANEGLEKTSGYVLQIMDRCRQLAQHGLVVFKDGWQYVQGDSGAAVSAAIGGILSGIFIINLNLKSLRSRQFARDNAQKTQEWYAIVEELQSKAFGHVATLNLETLKAIQLELPTEAAPPSEQQ